MRNGDIVAEIFEATAKSDGGPFVDAMAEHCVWRAIGKNSWSGVYHGKAAILRELFGPLSRRIEGGRTRTVASRIHAAGDFVVVEAEGRNRTVEGVAYDNQYCFVIRMQNGKFEEIVEYLDTALVDEALGRRLP